jgi:hypothetical protein
MPPIFFIQEKTENYKQQLIGLDPDDIITQTEKTEETIIFNNGMKAIFPFIVYHHDYGYVFLEFLNINDMKLYMHNEEIFDEKLKKSVREFIRYDYFDYDVFDKDE